MNVASSSGPKVKKNKTASTCVEHPKYYSNTNLLYPQTDKCNVSHFRCLDLDFGCLAHGFALLRLPRMPELRDKKFPDFIETTVDTDTIRYKDKNREKQRQKALAELKDKTPFPKKNFIKNKAWSKQKGKKERRQKMAAKRKHNEVFPFIHH